MSSSKPASELDCCCSLAALNAGNEKKADQCSVDFRFARPIRRDDCSEHTCDLNCDCDSNSNSNSNKERSKLPFKCCVLSTALASASKKE